jgi:hypothetical protein
MRGLRNSFISIYASTICSGNIRRKAAGGDGAMALSYGDA